MENIISLFAIFVDFFILSESFFTINMESFYEIISPHLLVIIFLIYSYFYLAFKHPSLIAWLVVLEIISFIIIFTGYERTNYYSLFVVFCMLVLFRGFEGLSLVFSIGYATRKVKLWCLSITVGYFLVFLNMDVDYVDGMKHRELLLFFHFMVYYLTILGAYHVCNYFLRHDYYGYTTLIFMHWLSSLAIALGQNHVFTGLFEGSVGIMMTDDVYQQVLPYSFLVALVVRIAIQLHHKLTEG